MDLIPQPDQVILSEGSFALSPYAKLVLPPRPSRAARVGAQQLRDEVLRFAGMPLEVLSGEARSGDIRLCLDGGLPPEGYSLTISPDGATLAGCGDAGLMHGVQTLRQIVRQSGCLLPCCRIEDKPRYGVRGYYFDVSRGRMPTLATLKRLADDACFLKLNQLQLYVEHTYLFRDLTEMWSAGEPLSASEIMQLDAYCADRGIELVPSLSCFGHLFELLHTKTYAGLCELAQADQMPSTMPNRMHHHTLNAADPRSLELIERLIAEFAPLFSSKRFNICADETFDLGKGRGKAEMDRVGERDFYTGFVKKLCEYVISLGLEPMFWGDIVVRFADALRMLPPGVICLNWGYSPAQTEDATRTLAQAGATQYVCPGVVGWNEWMNRLEDSYQNISRMAAYGARYGAVGLLNTDWGDYGHVNDPRFSLPGMAYGAAMSWSAEQAPFDRLNQAVSRLCYLDRSGSVVGLLARAQRSTVYSWRALVRYKEWRAGTLAGEESASPIGMLDPAKAPAANVALVGIEDELKRRACDLDTAERGMLHCWLNALEAMRLWNEAGACAAMGEKRPELAERLERWFRLYTELWRETSHESELWRTRDMVRWFADELR